MSLILVLLILFGGCSASRPDDSPSSAVGRANVAVIIGTLDLDRPVLDTTPEVGVTTEDLVPVPAKHPVVKAYAPAWRPASREFLEWYGSLPEGYWSDKPFEMELVESEEPEGGEVPLFVWETAQTSGWYGIDSLIAAYQQYPVSGSGPVVEGRRKDDSLATKGRKRDHDLVGVTATVPGQDLLPLILGEETTVRRRSSGESKFPLGYGATLVIPAETEISATHSGDETVVTVVSGAPKVLLPVLRKLWPVGVQRMRLRGDTLTVELDGWKDLTIKVGQ